ncbi:MAG: T9SS type A sorting domain-containing protein [Bacteroidota bacterium]
MKQFFTLLVTFMCLSTASYSQVMWDNFEDSRKALYGFIHGTLFTHNLNPAPGGSNTSVNCALYERNPVETFDVIVIRAEAANISDYVSGAKQMSIDVWSPAAGIPLQITLENFEIADANPFPAGRHSIYTTTTTVANQWETLTFNFTSNPELPGSGATVDNVNSLVLLFNPGNPQTQTFFWDNLRGPELVNDPCMDVAVQENILHDFECQQNINFFSSASPLSFRRVANPDMTGNTSDIVATYDRSGTIDDFIVASTDGPITLNPAVPEITMDIWSPTPAPIAVIFSLQDNAGNIIDGGAGELAAATTTSLEWETLTFPVPESVVESTTIERITMQFDVGTENVGTYFFDNIVIPSLVSTDDVELVTEMIAFPNPAKDHLRVEYNLIENSDVNITLTDITGRVIENRFIPNQAQGKQYLEFDTNDFADGIYLYNVRVNDQNNAGKIIVAK